MQNIDTLIHARWVIPVEPAHLVLEQHSIAIGQGRILEILPSVLARQKYHAISEVSLPEHALMPGLINAHTHASMSLFRGLADDLSLMDWLNQHIWPAESRWVSEEFVREGIQLAMAEMLRSGTTCFNDMYFFPDTTARAASQAGMRAVVGLIVIDFPSAWAQHADEYLHKGIQVHDQYHADLLITTTFAPHAPYTVADIPLQKVAMYAEEMDIPIHMHIHETAHEVTQALAEHSQRPLQRLAELGLMSPRLLAVHMTQLEDEDISTIAMAGAHIVHCPESNLKLASGFCPVHKLLLAGVNVALGTDGSASNNDLDMFTEMRTAALLAKGVAGDASALPAFSALQMATINGARALGLEHVTGSLQAGKAADIIAVRLDEIETQPLYHPVSQLVYAASRDKVSDVWVAGRRLLKNRQLTTLDENHLLACAKKWRERIWQNKVENES
ncbi:MAG: TRZ/ATZ family hydrolase [Thiohalomonadaceae bacterium]